MDVFQVFNTRNYTFIRTETANGGFKSIGEYPANGIIQHRVGYDTNGRQESFNSNTTLHMRPDEAFLPLVGDTVGKRALALENCFIRYDGVEYRINGAKPEPDDSIAPLEFYKCTLEKANLFVDELPLDELPLE